MNTTLIEERLERIENKIDRKHVNRFIDIGEVSELTSLSDSTIRRAVQRGEVKVSKATGKLLFKLEWVYRWLNG